jgi:hypothetical protein
MTTIPSSLILIGTIFLWIVYASRMKHWRITDVLMGSDDDSSIMIIMNYHRRRHEESIIIIWIAIYLLLLVLHDISAITMNDTNGDHNYRKYIVHCELDSSSL